MVWDPPPPPKWSKVVKRSPPPPRPSEANRANHQGLVSTPPPLTNLLVALLGIRELPLREVRVPNAAVGERRGHRVARDPGHGNHLLEVLDGLVVLAGRVVHGPQAVVALALRERGKGMGAPSSGLRRPQSDVKPHTRREGGGIPCPEKSESTNSGATKPLPFLKNERTNYAGLLMRNSGGLLCFLEDFPGASTSTLWGFFARCTTSGLTVPTLTPDLRSPEEPPQVDRKPSLQSTLHKTKWRISTSMCIAHVVADKQFVPNKCGHQYIHHNNAPGTHRNTNETRPLQHFCDFHGKRIGVNRILRRGN